MKEFTYIVPRTLTKGVNELTRLKRRGKKLKKLGFKNPKIYSIYLEQSGHEDIGTIVTLPDGLILKKGNYENSSNRG